jgi:hypothetical protein
MMWWIDGGTKQMGALLLKIRGAGAARDQALGRLSRLLTLKTL